MDRNDVIYKTFPHSFMGYDPIAVDAFLDEVIREFDRLTNTIDVLQFRLANEFGAQVDTAEPLDELPIVDEPVAIVAPAHESGGDAAADEPSVPGDAAEVVVDEPAAEVVVDEPDAEYRPDPE